MLKKLILVVLAVFFLIQFIPADLPAVIEVNDKDIITNNSLPDDISILIRETCYDCHSNETVYPWYSYVAPVSFLVSQDIRMGREHLNFSEWESLSKLDKAEALDDLVEEVEEGEMPLKKYVFLHPRARLSDEDRERFIVDPYCLRELLKIWSGGKEEKKSTP